MSRWRRTVGHAFLPLFTVAVPATIFVRLSDDDPRNLLAFAVALVVALGLRFLLVDFPLWRDLGRLTRAAARVHAGEADVSSGVSYAGDSGRLARVFDEMAATVQLRRQEDEAMAARVAQRADRERALAETSRALSELVSDYDTLLQRVVQEISTLVGDACSVSLVSDDGDLLEHVAFGRGGCATGTGHAPSTRIDASVIGEVARTGVAAFFPEIDPHAAPDWVQMQLPPDAEPVQIHGALVVPMRSRGTVVGVITALRLGPGRPYLIDDQVLFQDLADRAALAIHNSRLLGALERVGTARRVMLANLVSAQEDERRRIAADIHDDSVQVMAAAALRAGLVRDRLDDPAQARAMAALEQDIGLALNRLRDLLFALTPPDLERLGLASAVEACLRRMFPDGTPRFHLDNRLTSEPPRDMAVTAYRITQEALANIRKHAAATKVEVVLDEREGGVVASVLDDGVGLAPDATAEASPGHLGLTSMHERAEATGGWCKVALAEGVGTLVECWLPLAPAA